MKNTYLFIVILITILLSACEDVVQVDLKTAPTKLVIDASINWKKGTTGKDQIIKLSTTTAYYSNTFPKISGAIVFVKNSSNSVFNFLENQNKGEYICSNFKPILNETYTLTVISEGQTYTATEILIPVAPITKIVQNNQGGITGKKIEIKSYFNDIPNQANYYLYRYLYSNQNNSSYYADEDVFFQGNEFFSISQNDELKVGDSIEIIHSGISKSYFNYMNVLISIAGNSNGGPFQSPPATVRGNIINTKTFENYALGYFTLSEVDTKTYIIQ
ncbi:DUF4249 domain-containing protein [Flavobacterium cellulosilyticum]|uniref:DUF4249 domain-containing protein n=1 Tax=Flavobacterium cellulosilyticum TaxID=2541731 RepID=A0A4R5CET0_9FLAO|nr:DUF4249 domain-containing protein [Flavobacterium cellulosilyticum]TDD98598.1 DUF4249 domain-containing protein [Flavobacterium cellulosilyticum]